MMIPPRITFPRTASVKIDQRDFNTPDVSDAFTVVGVTVTDHDGNEIGLVEFFCLAGCNPFTQAVTDPVTLREMAHKLTVLADRIDCAKQVDDEAMTITVAA